MEQIAGRVESTTNYLRARDIPELIDETQSLARRQPALFLTGAVALGFIGARFLMSSGQRATAQRGLGASSAYATHHLPNPQQHGIPQCVIALARERSRWAADWTCDAGANG